ncbi:MAG: cysteine desulfurase [Clostridia bacterium]|nr:cysteine desulfurase [Clostridia bacterium]
MKEIYLDNSASTKISDEALAKYIEISHKFYGNPSSLHTMGYLAEKELRAARDTLLSSLSAKNSSVVFTASGSEANNLAIIGRTLSKERYKRGAKIITTDGEHASVSATLSHLAKEGFKIARIPTRNGVLDESALEAELDSDVILVTMMMVNNETGAIYDTSRVSRLMKIKAPEAFLHVDATQSFMKIKFTKQSIGADMISVSSHKIHGPKGVGALVVDNKVIKSHGLSPIIYGGGQEGGLRSGTENVPGIAAFAEAIRLASLSFEESFKKTSELRSYFIERLKEDALSEISPTLPEFHAPHIINITLPKIKSETMLHYLSSLGIFVSSGSACSSNSGEVSSALLAYGRSAAEADSSLRISFSANNTKGDVDTLCEALKLGLSKLARIR